MTAMKLNLKKINQELSRLGWTRGQYARRLGISRQLLYYYLKKEIRGIKPVEKLAKPFGIDPKDLLI